MSFNPSILKSKSGVTLFEMIVAVGVSSVFFAILILISASVLNNYERTKSYNKRRYEVVFVTEAIQHTVDSINAHGYPLFIEKNDASIIFYHNDDIIIMFNTLTSTLSYRIDVNEEGFITSVAESILAIDYAIDFDMKILTVFITDSSDSVTHLMFHIFGGVTA